MLDDTTQPKGVPNGGTSQVNNPIRAEGGQLKSLIERIERLRAEKADIAELEKEVFAEAKSNGYMTRPMRQLIALRARDPNDVAEDDAVLQMYKDAMGM